MNRGEIWTVAEGIYSGKPRPALIVQDDLFDATVCVTVAPLTSTLTAAPLLRVRVAPSELAGLATESDIMVDELTTVLRSNIGTRVGRVTATQLAAVERALMVFLGLAR
ncbi:MAG: type II toxin-antitoxin system PemK/MazF family toxin [Candidatus Dormibacteraceae bacterium]